MPTVLIAIGAIWFSFTKASPLPYGDEYALVNALTGETDMSVGYLFSRHNEHRLPAPRLAMHAVLPLVNYDFRYLAACVPLTIFTGLCLWWAARIAAGETIDWSENGLAVLFLTPGHAENFVWGWQLQYAFNVSLIMALFAVASLQQRWSKRTTAVISAFLLLLLAGCGVNGVITMVCVIAMGSVLIAFNSSLGKARFLYAALTAAPILLSPLMVLRGGGVQPPLQNILGGVGVFMSTATGLAFESTQSWLGPILAILLVIAIVWAFTIALRHHSPTAALTTGILGSLLLFAIGVGVGRTATSVSEAFQPRYFLLTIVWAPALIAILDPSIDRHRYFRRAICAAAFVIGATSIAPGFKYAAQYDQRRDAVLSDIENGVPLRLLALRHYAHPFGLFNSSANSLYTRLELMRVQDMGRVRDAQPSPTTVEVTADSDEIQVDPSSGELVFKNSPRLHAISWRWAIQNTKRRPARCRRDLCRQRRLHTQVHSRSAGDASAS